MKPRNRGTYRYGLPCFKFRATQRWTAWELEECKAEAKKLMELFLADEKKREEAGS